MVTATVITAYSCPLTTFPAFKYMVRILSELDNDCLAVVHKLKKAQKKWAQFLLVMRRKGADDRTLGLFYVSMVQEYYCMC